MYKRFTCMMYFKIATTDNEPLIKVDSNQVLTHCHETRNDSMLSRHMRYAYFLDRYTDGLYPPR